MSGAIVNSQCSVSNWTAIFSPLTFQKWHASGGGQRGTSFQYDSLVLRGIEPRVLPELDELAGSVARVSQEKFTVLFVAEFDDALSLQEVRQRAGQFGFLIGASTLESADVKFVEPLFQDVVFQRDELSIRAGVSLPRTPANELAIDSCRRVELSADHVQTSATFRVASQSDVSSSPGHVCGDGDSARLSGLADNFGFASVVARVQKLMLDSVVGQQCGQTFGLLDRPSSDQHRPTSFVLLPDLFGDGLPPGIRRRQDVDGPRGSSGRPSRRDAKDR